MKTYKYLLFFHKILKSPSVLSILFIQSLSITIQFKKCSYSYYCMIYSKPKTLTTCVLLAVIIFVHMSSGHRISHERPVDVLSPLVSLPKNNITHLR